MAGRFTLSPEAQHDLIAIRDFYLNEAGARVARHVLREITKALRFIAANPGVGHSRRDLTTEPVKFWPVFSYLIVCDPGMRPIGVARVLHANRDLMALFERAPPALR